MLTSKQLNDMIVSFGKSTAAMREDMQTILINAAAHAYQHGDVTFYDRLFANSSGVNRKLATKWVHDFGFATIDKDGNFKLNKTERKKADFKNGLECYEWLQLNARYWYEKEESMADVAKALDVAARINAIAASVGKVASGDHKTYNEVTVDPAAINRAMAALKAALIKSANHTTETATPAARIAA